MITTFKRFLKCFFPSLRKQTVSKPDKIFKIPYNMYMSKYSCKYDDSINKSVYEFQICHALSGTDMYL